MVCGVGIPECAECATKSSNLPPLFRQLRPHLNDPVEKLAKFGVLRLKTCLPHGLEQLIQPTLHSEVSSGPPLRVWYSRGEAIRIVSHISGDYWWSDSI